MQELHFCGLTIVSGESILIERKPFFFPHFFFFFFFGVYVCVCRSIMLYTVNEMGKKKKKGLNEISSEILVEITPKHTIRYSVDSTEISKISCSTAIYRSYIASYIYWLFPHDCLNSNWIFAFPASSICIYEVIRYCLITGAISFLGQMKTQKSF